MIPEIAVLGTVSKYLSDFLKLRRDRKKGAAEASLQTFIDWLRREEHLQEVELLLGSQQMQREIAKLIKGRQRRTVRQIAALLEPLAAQSADQTARLEALDTYVRDALPAEMERRFAGMAKRPEPSAEDRAFETGPYSKAILGTLDEVELYGADLSPESRQQKLSVAYISLSLGSPGESGASGPRRAEDVLGQLPPAGGRLLIRGEAGTGKSTLLRWIAVQWAECGGTAPPPELAQRPDEASGPETGPRLASVFHDAFKAGFQRGLFGVLNAEPLHFPRRFWDLTVMTSRLAAAFSGWRGRVPLLIRVRDCKNGELPPLEGVPESSLPTAGSAPQGWTRRVLSAGRALALIDGVDETAPKHRTTLRKQIEGLVNTYPDSLYLVTTRPGAVEEDWLAGLNFAVADVAPMTADDRARFIDKWHEAVQSEVDKRHKHEDVMVLASRLKAELVSNPPVARLATNPLLAAMICALHRDRRSKLPESQYELVEALCHMLLYRREYESGLDLTAFPEEYRNLSYPQRRGILQRLAAYMISQTVWSLDPKLALKRIEEELRTIPDRSPRDAKIVLRSLIERSGMLRERASGELDFIHNTFKEFLGARRYVQDDDLKALGGLALDADLEQVPLFAAATPENDELPTKLIARVLGKDDGAALTRRGTPTKADVRRYRCRLMAVRLAAVAQRLDPDVDRRVRALRRRVFPPRTLAAAAALAACGPGSERYLKRDPKMASRARVCCVRTLRLLESDAARRELDAYLNETDWGVVEELSQAMNPLLIPEVVRQLSRDDLDWQTIYAQRSVRARISDLTPLANLTQSQSLSLSQTAVTDLTPLKGLTQLQRLSLDQTGVTDPTPLKGLTQLEELDLSSTGVTDLTPLAGLTRLEGLSLSGTGVRDLTPLMGLTRLKWLSLSEMDLKDLTTLTGLTQLQELYLSQTGVTDLTPLAGLTQLRTLQLFQLSVTDLTPLAGLTQLQELYLFHTGVTDLTPLAALTQLQAVQLYETGVTDLTALRTLPEVKIWLDARDNLRIPPELEGRVYSNEA